MKKFLDHPLFTPMLLLAVSLLSYGGLILRPGVFGEDISVLWLYQRSGLDGLHAYFGEGKPLAALITTGLIGLGEFQIWVYHLLAVVLRWLGAWLFWLLVREVWPKNDGKALLTALIFLVYPGLKNTPIVISIFPHLMSMALTAAGFFLIYRGIKFRQHRWRYLIPGWLSGVSLLLSHYFIGLELLKILLIWAGWKRVEQKNNTETLKKTILTWLPFGGFLLARWIWGFPIPSDQSIAGSFRNSAGTIIRSLMDVLVLVWRQIVRIPDDSSEMLTYGLTVIFSGLIVFLALRKKMKSPYDAGTKGVSWRDEFLWVGLIALLAGGVPLWFMQESISLTYPASVSLLAFLPGVAILTAGLLDTLLLPRFQVGLAAILIALSVGVQLQNSNVFIKEWGKAEQIVQQLQVRLPAVKEGALLISEQVPLDYYSEENLTALFNLVYFPARNSNTEGLLYLDASSAIQEAQKDSPINVDHRGFRFSGQATSVWIFHQPEEGCLRLLQAGQVDLSGLPQKLAQTLEVYFSDFTYVEPGSVPIQEIFKVPTGAQRCILLGMIEQAGQRGDWQTAVNTMEQAGSFLCEVDHPYELIPLIETAAHAGQVELMMEISNEAAGNHGGSYELCNTFERLNLANDVSDSVKTAVKELESRAYCETYD
ncbi:MAG: hypothetical protein AB9891_16240 [Anaerolineaceae bacterium]